jgi:hypothetical protein
MPIVRRLSDTDDIAFSTGLGGVDGLAYGTIAILFRPAVDPVLRWIVTLHDAVGASLGAIGVLGGDPLLLWQGGGIWGTEGPAVTIGDWHLLVARKDTGDVRPRWSLKNVATGIWVHEDGTETQLDWTPPTGGSVRTLDAASGYGASSDFAAAAIWANSLPWAADAGGDAAIEAAGLDEHLDFWLDAEPSSGWEFSQPDALLFVEDFTLNRADETTAGVGVPTNVTDLDFIYATASLLALSRNYLRSTQDEPGAGGTVFDLSETQGTATTIGSGSISSGSFTKVLEFWRTVDATVEASLAINTSIAMSAVSASTLQYQWIVHRYNSAGVLQESSTPSAAHNTVGVKTQTMMLAGPFAAGDKLALSMWLRKAGGGGSRSFTLSINHAFSFVEFSVAEAGPEEHSGTGTADSITLTPGSGTGTPATTGAGQPTDTTLTPADGAGTPAIAGTGTPASLTLTADTGTGSAEGGPEEHSGSGTPATLTLAADTGTGTPATAGAGQPPGLTVTPAVGSGTPAVASPGNPAGLTLTAGAGAGTADEPGGGSGQPAGITLATLSGAGTPQVTGAGTAATTTLTTDPGAGAPDPAGPGTVCTLTLTATAAAGTPTVTGQGTGALLLLLAQESPLPFEPMRHALDGSTVTVGAIGGSTRSVGPE